jgi:UDP-N-acetyl-D-glucosamine dehydrogenase
VASLELEGERLTSVDTHVVAAADCTVVVTNHSVFNYRKIAEQAPLIVDTRNALKGITSAKIVRL